MNTTAVHPKHLELARRTDSQLSWVTGHWWTNACMAVHCPEPFPQPLDLDLECECDGDDEDADSHRLHDCPCPVAYPLTNHPDLAKLEDKLTRVLADASRHPLPVRLTDRGEQWDQLAPGPGQLWLRAAELADGSTLYFQQSYLMTAEDTADPDAWHLGSNAGRPALTGMKQGRVVAVLMPMETSRLAEHWARRL